MHILHIDKWVVWILLSDSLQKILQKKHNSQHSIPVGTAWHKVYDITQKQEIILSLCDSIPSLGVLLVTHYCMPDCGWTHQPACVQTCLVCSLLCNSRVPCSALAQTRSPEISVFHLNTYLAVCCSVESILAKFIQHISSKWNFSFWDNELLCCVMWWLQSGVKLTWWFLVEDRIRDVFRHPPFFKNLI